jgi:hypothetical protein
LEFILVRRENYFILLKDETQVLLNLSLGEGKCRVYYRIMGFSFRILAGLKIFELEALKVFFFKALNRSDPLLTMAFLFGLAMPEIRINIFTFGSYGYRPYHVV